MNISVSVPTSNETINTLDRCRSTIKTHIHSYTNLFPCKLSSNTDKIYDIQAIKDTYKIYHVHKINSSSRILRSQQIMQPH